MKLGFPVLCIDRLQQIQPCITAILNWTLENPFRRVSVQRYPIWKRQHSLQNWMISARHSNRSIRTTLQDSMKWRMIPDENIHRDYQRYCIEYIQLTSRFSFISGHGSRQDDHHADALNSACRRTRRPRPARRPLAPRAPARGPRSRQPRAAPRGHVVVDRDVGDVGEAGLPELDGRVVFGARRPRAAGEDHHELCELLPGDAPLHADAPQPLGEQARADVVERRLTEGIISFTTVSDELLALTAL